MRSVEMLVVGLGNPGRRYETTRHNVGYRVVERIARRQGELFRSGRELEGYEGPDDFEFALLPTDAARTPGPLRPAEDPGGPRDGCAMLLKPGTYMNLSGAVVAPVLAWASLAPSRLMVVYDDLDLPLGKLRIRPRGGPGTHNGMRSIVESLATERFPRLRVGIGPARTDAARHVLEPFADEERRRIEVAVEEAADAIRSWISTGDLDACMTRFHSRWNEGEPEPPEGGRPQP